MIRASVGTAGVLGLARVPMAVAPTTAYLMVGERCVMNCAFCAQGRESAANGDALSRITWPSFPRRKLISALKRAEAQGDVQRCCIQVTAGQDAYREALRVVRQIRRAVFLPLNVAVLPASVEQVVELIESGVDGLGLGLDAATERTFQAVKGPHWDHMLHMIEATATRFPGIASVHLIVGLGESERDMVERMMWLRDLGLGIGLFAFTPVHGTPLCDRPQPAMAHYRRIQAARWLILNAAARMVHFGFDGRGTLIQIRHARWPEGLSDGKAFETSGCPACNRPFYNDRPGRIFYNYPRPLSPEEAAQAVAETGLEDAR